MTRSDEPVLDVARGDLARSRHLRRCLALLRDRAGDPEFRRLADDVLAGRRGLRDVAVAPAFSRVLGPAVQAFGTRYAALSDDERRRLAAQGEAQLAEQRALIDRERRDRLRAVPHPLDDPDDPDDPRATILRPVR